MIDAEQPCACENGFAPEQCIFNFLSMQAETTNIT